MTQALKDPMSPEKLQGKATYRAVQVVSRVEKWRGGLGAAYLCPALSFAGASLAEVQRVRY